MSLKTLSDGEPQFREATRSTYDHTPVTGASQITDTALAAVNLNPECISLSAYERFRDGDLSNVQSYLGTEYACSRLNGRNLRSGGRFVHFRTAIGRISLNIHQYDFSGDEITLDCRSTGDFYLLCLALHGRGLVRNGSTEGPCSPGYIFGVNPFTGSHQEFEPDYRKIVLRIERPLLEAAYQQYTDKCPRRRIEFTHVPLSNCGPAQSLWRVIASACHELNSNAAMPFSRQRFARAYEAMVLGVLLESLPHSLSDEVHEQTTEIVAPACIKRVESYIHTHLTDDVLMEDLAAAAGKSARAVYYSFRRYRGTSPMEYLKECRLKLARAELERADETGKFITEIALACGFTHLSKFAGAYKKRFGETPSQTRSKQL